MSRGSHLNENARSFTNAKYGVGALYLLLTSINDRMKEMDVFIFTEICMQFVLDTLG